MPYPLPDKPYDTSDFDLFLVALPKGINFHRAAWGHFSDLGSPRFWGKEGYVYPDSEDAAQRMLQAIAYTLEIYEMGWLERMEGYTDEIEDLLRALETLQSAGGCCQNVAPVSDEPTSDYDDTNVPTTWGDESVTNLSDWQQLMCGAAHAYVDKLKGIADELNKVVGASVIVIGAVAGFLGLLGGAGIILAIGYGTAASVVSALVAGATAATFGNTAAEIEAARGEIVCAIVHGTSTDIEAAVQNAISAAAWTTFFQFVNYESAQNVIKNGGWEGEFLSVNRRSDCTCPVVIDATAGTLQTDADASPAIILSDTHDEGLTSQYDAAHARAKQYGDETDVVWTNITTDIVISNSKGPDYVFRAADGSIVYSGDTPTYPITASRAQVHDAQSGANSREFTATFYWAET